MNQIKNNKKQKRAEFGSVPVASHRQVEGVTTETCRYTPNFCMLPRGLYIGLSCGEVHQCPSRTHDHLNQKGKNSYSLATTWKCHTVIIACLWFQPSWGFARRHGHQSWATTRAFHSKSLFSILVLFQGVKWANTKWQGNSTQVSCPLTRLEILPANSIEQVVINHLLN